MPPTIRGRHQYRVQPRVLTTQPLDPVLRNGVIGDLLNRGRTSLVPGNPGYGAEAAPAAADPQKETKIGLYLLLGTVGLLAVSWLASGTKRNPQMSLFSRPRRKPRRGYFVRIGRRKRRGLTKQGKWRALGRAARGELNDRYGPYSQVPVSAIDELYYAGR